MHMLWPMHSKLVSIACRNVLAGMTTKLAIDALVHACRIAFNKNPTCLKAAPMKAHAAAIAATQRQLTHEVGLLIAPTESAAEN